MAKTLILYYSKTGFAQRYAQWLKEDLACDCFPFEKRGQVNLSDYDTVVFGAGCTAGKIRKAGWFRKQLPALAGKRLAVFFTGAMGPDPAAIKQCVGQNFSPEELQKVKVFYLWGGLNYEKMGLLERQMMKVFRSMLAAKKNPTPQDLQAAKMVAASFDESNRTYLTPLEDYVKQTN